MQVWWNEKFWVIHVTIFCWTTRARNEYEISVFGLICKWWFTVNLRQGQMISADENMNQLSYRIFSLLSWCLVMNTRRWHRNSPTKRMLHTLLIISRSIVLACMSKDTTERTLPTKGCPIWYAIFVVESFYNRKIKFVDIGISGKGIVCWHLLTRDVYVWQPKHCSL